MTTPQTEEETVLVKTSVEIIREAIIHARASEREIGFKHGEEVGRKVARFALLATLSEESVASERLAGALGKICAEYNIHEKTMARKGSAGLDDLKKSIEDSKQALNDYLALKARSSPTSTKSGVE